MITIRIEHADGQGPFNTETGPNLCDGNFLTEAYKRHFHYNPTEEAYPEPHEELLDLHKDDKEWVCGFKSIEQLQSLFKQDELKRLVKAGFKVLLLDVTEVQVSDKQILFTKESILSSKLINDLFI